MHVSLIEELITLSCKLGFSLDDGPAQGEPLRQGNPDDRNDNLLFGKGKLIYERTATGI